MNGRSDGGAGGTVDIHPTRAAVIRTPNSPPPAYTSPSASTEGTSGPPKKTAEGAAIQDQVDSVVTIMQSNLDRIMERGEGVHSLAQKSNNLQESTVQFQRNAAAVRRKLWWKNIKLNFVLLLAFLTLLIVVVLSLTLPRDKRRLQDDLTPPGEAPGTNPEPPIDPVDQDPHK